MVLPIGCAESRHDDYVKIAIHDAIWYRMRTIGIEDMRLNTRTLALLIGIGLPQVALAQNAALITTFTNPAPALGDEFGIAVAALGNDRVLIGAFRDGTGATGAGAAYLFNTNGALLTTFTSPTPAFLDSFGWGLATVGQDGILIGAWRAGSGNSAGGLAYHFNTNGVLMTTFTNPTPANFDAFGYTVSALGHDRVLIGAHFDDAAKPDSGAAYLFNTNGTLLNTFVSPSPKTNGYFGNSLTVVGNDRVLIGATGEDGLAGVAYLFNTNGSLLATITNPSPVPAESFGRTATLVGDDRILIGAYNDNNYTGAAHLYAHRRNLDSQLCKSRARVARSILVLVRDDRT